MLLSFFNKLQNAFKGVFKHGFAHLIVCRFVVGMLRKDETDTETNEYRDAIEFDLGNNPTWDGVTVTVDDSQAYTYRVVVEPKA